MPKRQTFQETLLVIFTSPKHQKQLVHFMKGKASHIIQKIEANEGETPSTSLGGNIFHCLTFRKVQGTSMVTYELEAFAETLDGCKAGASNISWSFFFRWKSLFYLNSFWKSLFYVKAFCEKKSRIKLLANFLINFVGQTRDGNKNSSELSLQEPQLEFEKCRRLESYQKQKFLSLTRKMTILGFYEDTSMR